MTIDVAQTVEQATADSAPPSFLETIMGLAPRILPLAPFGGLGVLPRRWRLTTWTGATTSNARLNSLRG